MPNYGRELFNRYSQVSNGFPADAMVSAAINILCMVIRENYGLRSGALAHIDELVAKWKDMTMRFYDPVTNRRRSTIPFTQRVNMPVLKVDEDFFRK